MAEDHAGRGDHVIEALPDSTGSGDIVFKTGGLDRHRIKADGTGTGVFGGVPALVSSVSRNGYGEIASYTTSNGTITATRNAFGVIQTVSDGVTTRTVARDGFGQITGVS
jgi:hypothetical protein